MWVEDEMVKQQGSCSGNLSQLTCATQTHLGLLSYIPSAFSNGMLLHTPDFTVWGVG